jgi:hypothetical protein
MRISVLESGPEEGQRATSGWYVFRHRLSPMLELARGLNDGQVHDSANRKTRAFFIIYPGRTQVT